MGASAPLAARRAFVSALLQLAAAYGVEVQVNRESGEQELLRAYRLVAKRAHPDKGGSKKHSQTLQGAKAMRPRAGASYKASVGARLAAPEAGPAGPG